MQMRDAATALSLCLASSGIMAFTGSQARELMTGSEARFFRLGAYAAGVMDQEVVVQINAKVMIQKGLPVPVWPFCPPKGASPKQIAEIIQHALFNEPENNHEDLILITRRALSKVWECTPAQLLE